MPPKLKLKKRKVTDTTADQGLGEPDGQSPQVTAELKNQLLETVKYLRIQKDELEIDPDSELVRAGFSEVRKATLVRNGDRTSVAVKMFRWEGDSAERARLETAFLRELNVWATFDDESILRLLGFRLEASKGIAIFVSPWCPHGNVVEFVTKHNLDQDARLELVVDITYGLQYLHDKGVSHGDLKPANIIIDAEENALLCDFGLSKAVESSSGLTTATFHRHGTYRYISPELYLPGSRRSLQSDIWAYGCVVLQVLTDRAPYGDAQTDTAVSIAIINRESPDSPNNLELPDAIQGMLQSCWAFDPSLRWTISACLDVVDPEEPSPVSSSLSGDGGRKDLREKAFEHTRQRIADLKRSIWEIDVELLRRERFRPVPYQPKIQSRYPEIQTLRNLLQGVTSENSGNNYLGVEIEAVDGGSEDDSEEGIDEHDIDLFMVQADSNTSRKTAVKYLKEHDGGLINALIAYHSADKGREDNSLEDSAEKDIDMFMLQTATSRETAVKYLKGNDGDVLNASTCHR